MDRIFVVRQSTQRFCPTDGEPEFDVVSVGQLVQRKRMDVLIDAAAELKRRGRPIRVGILGDGELRESLTARIRERGLEDSVRLLGYRNDVERVLQSGRIFSLGSEWEGLPFAMIEAACWGLVPVMTDVGTIGDFLTPGENGEFVPVGDVTALADTLARLLANPEELERQRAGALRHRETMSLEAGVDVWERVLLSQAHGSGA